MQPLPYIDYDEFVYQPFRIQYRKNINLSSMFKKDFTSIILFTTNLFIRMEFVRVRFSRFFSSSFFASLFFAFAERVTPFASFLFSKIYLLANLDRNIFLLLFLYYIPHRFQTQKYVELENHKGKYFLFLLLSRIIYNVRGCARVPFHNHMS